MGKLPGQRSKVIKFATEPGGLRLVDGAHPFGRCHGFRPKGCQNGYGSDDIYPLEICLFSQLCENGEELFELEVGDPFKCKFSAARLTELKDVLLEPPLPTNEAYTQEALTTCKGWCRSNSCNRGECVGCGEDKGCTPLARVVAEEDTAEDDAAEEDAAAEEDTAAEEDAAEEETEEEAEPEEAWGAE
mmetsp:Transcript_9556/g.24481  ORF Transcript_9556/g.24481 Transcript_9556/m.24481 type:complete len:188 (+) Transcript_9556:1-564(+)